MEITRLSPHHNLPSAMYCLVFDYPNGKINLKKTLWCFLLLLFFSNELSFVVLTQSWGWSYSCVSFNDEGL